MLILGISAYYHDSAAALISSSKIVSAAQEERFSRKKHDPCFPEMAIKHCLEEAKVSLSAVDYIVFYDKPLLKFERLMEAYLSYAPRGFTSFVQAMPVWMKEKLDVPNVDRSGLRRFGVITGFLVVLFLEFFCLGYGKVNPIFQKRCYRCKCLRPLG